MTGALVRCVLTLLYWSALGLLRLAPRARSRATAAAGLRKRLQLNLDRLTS